MWKKFWRNLQVQLWSDVQGQGLEVLLRVKAPGPTSGEEEEECAGWQSKAWLPVCSC